MSFSMNCLNIFKSTTELKKKTKQNNYCWHLINNNWINYLFIQKKALTLIQFSTVLK